MIGNVPEKFLTKDFIDAMGWVSMDYDVLRYTNLAFLKKLSPAD